MYVTNVICNYASMSTTSSKKAFDTHIPEDALCLQVAPILFIVVQSDVDVEPV